MQDFCLLLQMGNGPSQGIRYVGRGSDSTNDNGAPDSSPDTSNNLVDSPQAETSGTTGDPLLPI